MNYGLRYRRHCNHVALAQDLRSGAFRKARGQGKARGQRSEVRSQAENNLSTAQDAGEQSNQAK